MTTLVNPSSGVTWPNNDVVSPQGLQDAWGAEWDTTGGNLVVPSKMAFSGDVGVFRKGVLFSGAPRKTISYLGKGQSGAANGANIVRSLIGLGLIEGDLVLAVQTSGCKVDRTAGMSVSEAGWTNFRTKYANGSSEDASVQLYYKYMGATPDTAMTFNFPGISTDASTALVVGFRGVAPANEIVGLSAGGREASSANLTPITRAVSFAGSTVIALAGFGFNGPATAKPAPWDVHSWVSWGDSNDSGSAAGAHMNVAPVESYQLPDFADCGDAGGRGWTTTLVLPPAKYT